MKDALGRELKVGQQVVWAASTYTKRIIWHHGIVDSFSPKMARVKLWLYGVETVETLRPHRLVILENV